MAEEVKAPRAPKRVPKKKVCTFCVDHVDDIDYKDVAKLRRFITEKGKILPRRMSGVCAKHKGTLPVALKGAGVMPVLPYKAD